MQPVPVGENIGIGGRPCTYRTIEGYLQTLMMHTVQQIYFRFIAAVMIWTSLILSTVLLLLSAVYSFMKYWSLKDVPEADGHWIDQGRDTFFRMLELDIDKGCRQKIASVVTPIAVICGGKIPPFCSSFFLPHFGFCPS